MSKIIKTIDNAKLLIGEYDYEGLKDRATKLLDEEESRQRQEEITTLFRKKCKSTKSAKNMSG